MDMVRGNSRLRNLKLVRVRNRPATTLGHTVWDAVQLLLLGNFAVPTYVAMRALKYPL